MKFSLSILCLLFVFLAQAKDTLYIYVDEIQNNKNLLVHSFQENLCTKMFEVYAKTQLYGFSYFKNDSTPSIKYKQIVTSENPSFALKLTVMLLNDVFENYSQKMFLDYKASQGYDTAILQTILSEKSPYKEYQNLKYDMGRFESWFARNKWLNTASVFTNVPTKSLSSFFKNKKVVYVSGIKTEEDFMDFKKRAKESIIYLLDENSKNMEGYLLKPIFYAGD